MTPTGIAALICLAVALVAFAGVVYVYWPRAYPADDTRYMAHPERGVKQSTLDPLTILREGRPESEYTTGAGYRFPHMLRRIECADGFDLSVQAGELLYSTPRANEGPWTAVEVGYPSATPEPWDEWSKYAEEPDRPTSTVYSYVPLSMVEALIEAHVGPR